MAGDLGGDRPPRVTQEPLPGIVDPIRRLHGPGQRSEPGGRVYFGIVNRMILAELVKVFLMSLVALTGMFLLAGLIQEATQKGLSPGQI